MSEKPRRRLCFHGTSQEAAQKILLEGFKPDCWFASHMEVAAHHGEYVFAVPFERRLIPRGAQFHVPDAISPLRIKRLVRLVNVPRPRIEPNP